MANRKSNKKTRLLGQIIFSVVQHLRMRLFLTGVKETLNSDDFFFLHKKAIYPVVHCNVAELEDTVRPSGAEIVYLFTLQFSDHVAFNWPACY